MSPTTLTLPVHSLTTAEAFLPMLDGHPQKLAPGSRFSYCNGGYMVLAVLLERATGETYHEVVRRLVLEPAGLERTGFLPLNALPADAAAGYVHDAGDLVNTLHLPVLGNGDGGAFATAADLHRFWLALLDGRIVSRATLDAMIAPRHDVPDERKRYGMGFWLHPTHDALILEGYDAGGHGMSDARVLGPDLAPTPFTAAEIRDRCRDGRRLLVRTRLDGMTTYHCDTFAAGDPEGCELTQVVTDASGTPVEDPRPSRVTWRELQEHAAFPAAATTVEPERIVTPIGGLECLRYDVRQDCATSTFWFATAHPGMPVRYRTGDAVVEVIALD